ncbi:MAG: threonine synthase, partial [Phycisphaeraceae bacterium]
AFGKAFAELKYLGLIDKIPRLAVIQAAGANPLHELYNQHGVRWNDGKYDREKVASYFAQLDAADHHAHTVASAIEIGRPVNLPKALRALDVMDGVVREVDDATILEHKAMVGRFGFGCEPASAASVAGARMLREEGLIDPGERVVCILTGHLLKDPDATVKYHTGIDMKAAQSDAPRSQPYGTLSNRPIPVADDIEAIIAAITGDADVDKLVEAAQAGLEDPGEGSVSDLPVSEY